MDLTRPPRGWLRAIREALGLTTAQLALRLGVSQPRVVATEKAERDSSITLASLQRAALALDCQLVYALVPRKPLDALVTERAKEVARQRLELAGHTMALEAQSVRPDDMKKQFERLVGRLVDQAGPDLWRDTR